jgi:hypothetical protein
MPKVIAEVTEEALAFARVRIAHKSRGIGQYLSSLILQDRARCEEQVLLERRRETPISSKESWREPSVRVV